MAPLPVTFELLPAGPQCPSGLDGPTVSVPAAEIAAKIVSDVDAAVDRQLEPSAPDLERVARFPVLAITSFGPVGFESVAAPVNPKYVGQHVRTRSGL